MPDESQKPVPPALAMSGAFAFCSASLWAVWQVAFAALGVVFGGGMEIVVRLAAIAAIVATLAAVWWWPWLRRTAHRSFAAALSMVSVGLTGTYWLLPRAFVYAEF